MATLDRNGTRHLTRVESALRLTDRGRAHVREWRGEPCAGVIRLTAAVLADAVADWARRGSLVIPPGVEYVAVAWMPVAPYEEPS